ncbi:MoxR family ATPase [Microbacterium sp. EYE_5]|uniref:AAA family ATPase n=1 Tax=unclassified Microbacterium TaxID=2609290 RepID=UPI002004848B|nr:MULTISPECIES: MoxR family ATPase [unclassified Microbacterium]MCK6081168.1 MoxR family ATPase [Microbacterium sp. EYE_382]MCK6086438.1 MoxR family ATPase [Microbacterium sp. EYE_384]MCK6124064.1 MoxR family ATPase [Microbacterium sp. EYE_80]MCK6126973.1 MoxR family ATPase [Microbacterium sp. EYE_79]MCK6142123.1 MoxR family ATPase [Microbacterium sp. EYE_39]
MTITQEQSTWFSETFATLVENVEQVVLGKRHVIELAFTTMIAEGHLLLEDYPGTGKTSLARAMGRSVQGSSSRIQFTPDLLPGDVTGITVYDQRRGEFEFHQGPIFANVVLADEINRASPKTQSALLEVMEEGHVTVDGITRPVGLPFLVVATQNPVEQAGTYRLPEAQLDRFLMKTSLGYPDHAATIRILEGSSESRRDVEPVITPQGVVSLADIARGGYLHPLVLDYIARIVDATRLAREVRLGVSVRGALALTKAARTWALAHGRTYVTPDDVKALAGPVLAHRLILDPEAEFDGVTAEAVVGQILLDVVPPSQRDDLGGDAAARSGDRLRSRGQRESV